MGKKKKIKKIKNKKTCRTNVRRNVNVFKWINIYTFRYYEQNHGDIK